MLLSRAAALASAQASPRLAGLFLTPLVTPSCCLPPSRCHPSPTCQVQQPVFIDPATGMQYAPATLPCEAISFAWSHQNFWANLQCAGDQLAPPGVTDWSFANPNAWEALLPNAGGVSRRALQDLRATVGQGAVGCSSLPATPLPPCPGSMCLVNMCIACAATCPALAAPCPAPAGPDGQPEREHRVLLSHHLLPALHALPRLPGAPGAVQQRQRSAADAPRCWRRGWQRCGRCRAWRAAQPAQVHLAAGGCQGRRHTTARWVL